MNTKRNVTPLLRRKLQAMGKDAVSKFAKQAKVSISLIQKVRCGIYVPKKAQTISKLAQALGVTEKHMMRVAR